MSNDNVRICLDEPQMAHTGGGYARIMPTSASGPSVRQENILLQPGAGYLLTYYVRPVASGTRIPTSSATITYVGEDGKTKIIQEAQRLPLIRDRYMQRRFFFTLPEGSAPIPCKVMIAAMTHSVAGDYLCVDDASLTRADDSGFDKYGYYAWISNIDEPLYKEPGGEVICVRNTNDVMMVYSQKVVAGVLWYFVKDAWNTVGWIEEGRLAWNPPQISTDKKYVELNADRVWPRNRQMNRHAYHWPKGRRLLVREYDDTYYETRYAGQIAYVEKSKCDDLPEDAVDYWIIQRTSVLAQGEHGQTNSRYYGNAQGDWNAAFVESVVMAAGISRSELPRTRDVEQAVLFWLRYPGTVRFYFWDVDIKRAYKEKYAGEITLTDDITSVEKSMGPAIGYLLYFLTDNDRASMEAGGRLASHVGIITKVGATEFEVMFADMESGSVARATFPIDWRGAVGVGVPNYGYTTMVKVP